MLDGIQNRVYNTGWSSEYYVLPEGARELQDLIEHREMNFAIGNIFKAAYRLGEKEGTDAEYDLNKIIWFATRELQRIRKEKGSVNQDNVRNGDSGGRCPAVATTRDYVLEEDIPFGS